MATRPRRGFAGFPGSAPARPLSSSITPAPVIVVPVVTTVPGIVSPPIASVFVLIGAIPENVVGLPSLGHGRVSIFVSSRPILFPTLSMPSWRSPSPVSPVSLAGAVFPVRSGVFPVPGPWERAYGGGSPWMSRSMSSRLSLPWLRNSMPLSRDPGIAGVFRGSPGRPWPGISLPAWFRSRTGGAAGRRVARETPGQQERERGRYDHEGDDTFTGDNTPGMAPGSTPFSSMPLRSVVDFTRVASTPK